MTTRLRAESVELRYPGSATAAVHDVSLEVRDGRVTTIIGPNGCGKSTLLRALGRMMRPGHGTVVLDGELIHRLPTKEVARRLGLLHQQVSAPEGITVEDLARRGRYPHQGFLQPPDARDVAAVDAALELAGISELRGRAVDTLSGGQRQRAWIAMVLAQETDLLLLDEPTTFLDVSHQLEVIELAARLNAAGKTVVMVLHDVNEAARVSHHVVAMKAGSIVCEGAPDDIITPDLLAELYGVACDVFAHPRDDHPVCNPVSAITVGDAAPPAPREPEGGIAVVGLGTGYGASLRVSHELSVELPAGTITTIVGPNACGKSTLLRTGARLLGAYGGSFLLDGHDSHHGSRRALARRVAMVMQGPAPPAGFVVEDIVAAGRMPHQGFLRQWTRGDAAAISSALERCGLADLRYREIDTLSGGQRQRAWIAMALAQDTPFLFLDEPTTFLDLGYQTEVLDLVHRLNRSEGRTVLMVLHDLNLAARYSDRVVVMADGAIVAHGHPDDVITHELVRTVFGIDSEITTDPRSGRPLVVPTRRIAPTGIEPGHLL